MRYIVWTMLLSLSVIAQENAAEVVPINQEQLQHIIKNREGKILFLNIWATWCKPCIEEFPDIVSLAERYRDNAAPVEFVAVSADYPDEIESLIAPFLKKFTPVPFKVYVADFTSMDQFISSIDPEWTGAVPATFLYSAEGTRKKMLIGQHSFAQFKTHIDSLILHP